MRKSRKETARTRERIIESASAEFREHGIVGTGLADLMKAAGLTHGGFYKHFTSKDELVREVAAASIGKSTATMKANADKRPGRKGLSTAVASYLCAAHRDNPRDCFPFASLGADSARADAKPRAASPVDVLYHRDAIVSHYVTTHL